MGPQTNSDGFDAYLSITPDSSVFFVKEDPEVRYADVWTVKLIDPLLSKARKDSALRAQLDKDKDKGKGGKTKGKKKNGNGDDDDDEEAKKKYLTDKDPRTPEEIYRELNSRNRLQNKDFESILFDFGKFAIRPEGKKVLEKAIKFLKQNPTVGIELVGHTDSVSGDLVNQILSDRRSFEAKQYLMRQGISRNRILNHGFGKQIFANENETETGRQRNRRCELNLLMSKEEFEAYKDRFKNNSVVIPPTAPGGQK
jgi:outer membrane protein OmpA-like peptidoglycan-associated protein